jgi:hypothetical protein
MYILRKGGEPIMKKSMYEAPEFELIEFVAEDITMSDPTVPETEAPETEEDFGGGEF